MKNFSFDGRLGKDAEVKATKGGKPYVRFSVANNSFSGGTENTEWIDVTSYDQYVVENRAKYLTKGTYVIVNGDVRFEVSVKDNKVWKNIYVNANSIDTPSFGKKEDGQQLEVANQPQSSEPEVSTYTAATVTTKLISGVEEKASVPTVSEAPTVQPMYTANVAPATASVGDDDLPF